MSILITELFHIDNRRINHVITALNTEEGILNATETAVCNLSEFYWCSKRYLFSCYIQR